MPEGPEVEAARALVARNVLNLKIVKAVVADDEKVFMGKSPQEVAQALEGRCITAACRKAKYLWFVLDGDGPFPLLHFGMTGAVIVEGVGAAKYKRVNVDTSDWPPKFWKLQLEFEGGARLAFADARRFGRVQLLTDPRTQEPVSKLGFDVIDELPDLPQFAERFAARVRPGSSLRVKALLLDQGFTAGVGNWVADEVLYQARIHPEQPVADMTEYQIEATHTALKNIMQLAVAVDADSDQFPRDWLFHYRWTGKKASSIGGHAVDFVTVGSRTSAFVPALQKIITGTGLSTQKPEPKARKPRRKSAPEAGEGKGDDGAGSDVDDDAEPPPAPKPTAKKPRAKKSVPAKADAGGTDKGTPAAAGGSGADVGGAEAGSGDAGGAEPAEGDKVVKKKTPANRAKAEGGGVVKSAANGAQPKDGGVAKKKAAAPKRKRGAAAAAKAQVKEEPDGVEVKEEEEEAAAQGKEGQGAGGGGKKKRGRTTAAAGATEEENGVSKVSQVPKVSKVAKVSKAGAKQNKAAVAVAEAVQE